MDATALKKKLYQDIVQHIKKWLLCCCEVQESSIVHRDKICVLFDVDPKQPDLVSPFLECVGEAFSELKSHNSRWQLVTYGNKFYKNLSICNFPDTGVRYLLQQLILIRKQQKDTPTHDPMEVDTTPTTVPTRNLSVSFTIIAPLVFMHIGGVGSGLTPSFAFTSEYTKSNCFNDWWLQFV